MKENALQVLLVEDSAGDARLLRDVQQGETGQNESRMNQWKSTSKRRRLRFRN
jgi:hypothetical protein